MPCRVRRAACARVEGTGDYERRGVEMCARGRGAHGGRVQLERVREVAQQKRHLPRGRKDVQPEQDLRVIRT